MSESPSNRPSRDARWWMTRCGLLLGGLVLGIGLAEGLSRLISPAGHADLLFNSPDSSPYGLYVNDAELLLIPSPGFNTTVESLDYEIELQINELGIRGPTTPLEESHWLAVGDSFTMAVQVSEEDSFVGQLTRSTEDSFLNAGVDGYSTWQSLARYRRLVAQGVNFDGVLLTFFLGNDFHDNSHFDVIQRQASTLQSGTPIPRERLPWYQQFLLRHSVLYAHYRVWSKAQELQGGNDHDRGRWQQELSIFSSEGEEQLRYLSEKTTRALQALQQATSENGDQLLVAIAPPAFVVDPSRLSPTFEVVGLDPNTANLRGPSNLVQRLLTETGIQYCDLTPALQEAHNEGEKLYFVYDGHWTPEGHTVVAETVASCLETL